MMRASRHIFFLTLAAIMGLGIGPVQKPAPLRVMIVMEGRNIKLQPQVNGLRDGLEELKYVEGENLNWQQIDGGTSDEIRANLGAALERQRMDVLVTLGTTETSVAKEVAPNIPTVFLPAADPVKSGFARSLSSPGANLTGLTFFTDAENLGKQLEVFKQVVPSLNKVGVLFDARLKSSAFSASWKRFSVVASWLGIHLSELPVMSSAETGSQIAALPNPAMSAGIFVFCSGLFKDVEGAAAAAMKRKLPLFGCNAFQVAEQNVLLSYAPDLYSLGYRGAWFVDRIFKGARPRDLPVETPRRFELVINSKVASETGLKISPGMLMLADRVFR
ncbi:MAG TPA: ABC transporter substrate-binding protein [Candidatus Binatia bacterium]